MELRGSYVLSVIVSGVSTTKVNACLLCSAGAEMWSGVLSSVVRSVYFSFTLSLFDSRFWIIVCNGPLLLSRG